MPSEQIIDVEEENKKVKRENEIYESLLTKLPDAERAMAPLIQNDEIYCQNKRDAMLYLSALMQEEPFSSDIRLERYYRFVAPALAAAFLVDQSCKQADNSIGWFQHTMLQGAVPGLACDNKLVEEWTDWVKELPFLETIQRWHGKSLSPYLSMAQRAVFFDVLQKLCTGDGGKRAIQSELQACKAKLEELASVPPPAVSSIPIPFFSASEENSELARSLAATEAANLATEAAELREAKEEQERIVARLKKDIDTERKRAKKLAEQLFEDQKDYEALEKDKIACDSAQNTLLDQLENLRIQLRENAKEQEEKTASYEETQKLLDKCKQEKSEETASTETRVAEALKAKEDADAREAGLKKRIQDLEEELAPIKERAKSLDEKLQAQTQSTSSSLAQLIALEASVAALFAESQSCRSVNSALSRERDAAIVERNVAIAALATAQTQGRSDSSGLQAALEAAERRLEEAEREKERAVEEERRRGEEERKKEEDERKRVEDEKKRQEQEKKRLEEEEKDRIEKERVRADEERLKAEEERGIAELARKKAEEELQRAQQEKEKAEEEAKKAEEERKRAEEEKAVAEEIQKDERDARLKAEKEKNDALALAAEQKKALEVAEQNKLQELQLNVGRVAALEKQLQTTQKRLDRCGVNLTGQSKQLADCTEARTKSERSLEKCQDNLASQSTQLVECQEQQEEQLARQQQQIAEGKKVHDEFLNQIALSIGRAELDSDKERFAEWIGRFNEEDRDMIQTRLRELRASGQIPALSSSSSNLTRQETLEQELSGVKKQLYETRLLQIQANEQFELSKNDLDAAQKALAACETLQRESAARVEEDAASAQQISRLQEELDRLTKERDDLQTKKDQDNIDIATLTDQVADLQSVKELGEEQLKKCQDDRDSQLNNAIDTENKLVSQLRSLQAEYEKVSAQLAQVPKVDEQLVSRLQEQEIQLNKDLKTCKDDWSALKDQVDVLLKDNLIAEQDKVQIAKQLRAEQARVKTVLDDLENTRKAVASANNELNQLQLDRKILLNNQTKNVNAIEKLRADSEAELGNMTIERDNLRDRYEEQKQATETERKEKERLQALLNKRSKQIAELEQSLFATVNILENRSEK